MLSAFETFIGHAAVAKCHYQKRSDEARSYLSPSQRIALCEV
jgi:hypothetical protein